MSTLGTQVTDDYIREIRDALEAMFDQIRDQEGGKNESIIHE